MKNCEVNIHSEANTVFASTYISFHKIGYLYANLCEYFEANMKQIMRINGVCEFTEKGQADIQDYPWY
jgi:hypothetical protein